MSSVKINMETAGGRRVLAALRGLRRAIESGGRSTRSEAAATRRAVEQGARAQSTTERKEAESAARTTENAEKRKRSAFRRTDEERRRSANATRRRAREAAREERVQRAPRRGRGGIVRDIASGIGGGVAGGARSAFGVIQSLQSTFGIRSIQDVIGSSVDARQSFIRQAIPAGLQGGEIQAAIERAAGISQRTGVSPEEILRGIEQSQEGFSQLAEAVNGGQSAMDDFFQNIEFMAQVARVSGASMEDVVNAAGSFSTQFSLNAEQTREALAIIAAGAQQGSLSLADFADTFPQSIASFQQARGVSGLDALREFAAVGQGLRAARLDPRVARTRQEALFTTLVSRQRQLRQVGINVTGEGGRIRSISDIVRQAATSRRAQDPRRLQAALGSQEATQALSILLQQEQRAMRGDPSAVALADRVAVDAESGASLFTDTLQALNQDASGDIINQRIQREAALVAESDNLIERFGELTRTLTRLETENPFLSEVGAPVGEGVVGGLGAGALASRLLGGGTAATAGGGGLLAGSGGVLAAGGTTVGAASAAAISVAVAAGLAIAGVVVAGISALGLFKDQTGRSLLQQIGDIPEDSAAAFGGGVIDSIANAFTGSGRSESAEIVLARRAARKETVALDPETIRQIRPQNEPGAGRRGEGAPGE